MNKETSGKVSAVESNNTTAASAEQTSSGFPAGCISPLGCDRLQFSRAKSIIIGFLRLA